MSFCAEKKMFENNLEKAFSLILNDLFQKQAFVSKT